jgi:type VI secretion system protein ImpM
MPNPAGCYGKLPIFADFIRYNYRSAEVDQLDQWFQEGIYYARQSLGQQWETAYEKGPPSRFIFRPPGSSRFLVGASVPGTDKAGRHYPFAIFLNVECASFERDAALLPSVFREFLDPAQDLASQGWKGADVKQLFARIDGLRGVDVGSVNGHRARHDEYLRRERASAFWSGIFGGPSHPGRITVIQNLLDALQTIRSTPAGRPTLGLKFPLPRGGSEACAAAAGFWMDLSFRLIGWRSVPSLAFWRAPEGARAPELNLFFTGTSPRYFPLLILPDYETDALWDLSKGGAASSDRIAQMLNGPDPTLGDLAGKLAAANKR